MPDVALCSPPKRKALLTHRKRHPGKGSPKVRAKLKSHWAKVTLEERRVRITQMDAGRKDQRYVQV
jgi:hypothetical protein